MKLKNNQYKFSLNFGLCLTILFFNFYHNYSYAQGGSNYSIFGYGDFLDGSGAAYQSLAGTGIAMPLESGINVRNPAAWSLSNMTRLKIGYIFNQNYISNDKVSLFQNNGKINGALGLFSIDTSLGLSVGFGLYPYSTVNYYLSVPVNQTVDGTQITGQTTYQGQGGLSSGYIGSSIKLLNRLSIGVSAFTIFGNINSVTRTDFTQAYTYNYLLQTSDYFKGFGIRFGIFSEPLDNLYVGMYYEKNPLSTINRDMTYSYDNSLTTVPDTTYSSKLSDKLPDAFGIGLSLRTGKFLIGTDFNYQNFENITYNKGIASQFTNQYSVSAGIQRMGNKYFNAPYSDKITYNFGIGYKKLYYTILGNNITEIYGSIGGAFPLGMAGVLDASLLLGTRGTTNSGLVKEYFARLCLDMSIGEVWFKPFKRNK